MALKDIFKRGKVAATSTAGAHGTAVYGGYIQSNEKNSNLSSQSERYKVYSEIMANTTIVATGIRNYLNLVASAEWSFAPSEADTTGEWAEKAEEMLTKDPMTTWARIVRRAAMYRLYGFSVQEWTAVRRDDGALTFKDIAPRAQATIERWEINDDGTVETFKQRSPQTGQELDIPRAKCLYLVDDTLSDSPEGLGLFRHLAPSASRLARYEQLEGWGFETDLRGIPVGRGPFTELAQQVEDGTITQAQRVLAEAPLRSFIQNHVKSATTGMLLDSKNYESQDEAGRATGEKLWDMELLKGSATSFAENAAAIERINREMARVLGVEHLLLGSDSAGSFALSTDKTNNFFLMVDGALNEIRESVEDDLLDVLWQLNGWDNDLKPEITTEAIRQTDFSQVAAVLRDLATAGSPIFPDDPIIGEIRDLMGMPRPEETIGGMEDDLDASLGGKPAPKAEPKAKADEVPEPGDKAKE